jgi:hypothetical protein
MSGALIVERAQSKANTYVVPLCWNEHTPKHILYFWCLSFRMGTVKTKYMSGVFILEWARPKTNIVNLVPPCWNGNSPKRKLYVWCLDVWMGKAQNKYCKSGSSMLGWEQSKAKIICLVSLYWNGHGPKQVL